MDGVIYNIYISYVCIMCVMIKQSKVTGFVCFVVINPLVLLANRVDFGFFHKFSNFTPLDRNTTIGKICGDYLASGLELSDRAIHLMFSANRWEKMLAGFCYAPCLFYININIFPVSSILAPEL